MVIRLEVPLSDVVYFVDVLGNGQVNQKHERASRREPPDDTRSPDSQFVLPHTLLDAFNAGKSSIGSTVLAAVYVCCVASDLLLASAVIVRP